MEIEPSCGLEYIVENPEYTEKLGKALDCNNTAVKKKVFELLSALCVYNADGYARALQAIEHYKEFKLERYRFKFIVEELRYDGNSLEYRSVVLAFINCLIISTPVLKERTKIRNEFIGLKLLPVLSELRRCVASYPDLGVQIDVFEEQRDNDEAQLLDAPYGVDLNSHVDVFYAILKQVADTPQEIPFLSILQHLLRIDPKEAISDIVWDTAETLVHRATLLESRQDATRILRSPSVQSRLCCHGHRSVPDAVCGSRKQSLNIPTSPVSTIPPPPPPPSLGGPPPPPPPPPPIVAIIPQSNAINLTPAHLKSHPLLAAGTTGSPNCEGNNATNSDKPAALATELPDLKLPQQETPVPKAKMKTINWNKIPNNKVVGRHNIWSVVARSHQHSPMADLDWSEMEGLFCQQNSLPSTPSNQSSPKLGRDTSESSERRRKEPSEIVLLDGKRSLNVNIFLKQFRCSNEDIIQIIKDGGHDDIGAEKLRGLLKMLPEIDELEMLRSFDGDKTKLGNAEKFLLQLIEVSNYKLRIESMLLKEEFASNMSYLEPSINAMIVAGEDLMTNKSLQEVLYMVICAGNFLNSGGYAGNAAGVKLSSLQKLTDIRANKPGMNLIHYVASQVEKKKKHLLKFADDMAILEDATKTTVEQLQNEINMLDSRVKKIKQQVELPSTETEIKEQTRDFIKMAETEVTTLQHDLLELESVRKSLSEYFCEDPATFKIEDCFKIFHGFCLKFKQAIVENERRKLQEEQANARRRQREEHLAAKRKFVPGITIGTVGKPENDCESIMDSLLNDLENGSHRRFDKDNSNKIRRSAQNGSNSMLSDCNSSVTGSPVVMRRRLGSYSGDPPATNSPEDTYSPDVTPTGSLRRRRSRVPSEEDESSLMDFLRSSAGPENLSKDRKSWGSLDRSWARRARGGKRRPDLLTADLSTDRERPSSPSPLLESKSLLPTPEEETKPRAWRQKIEAWLQENEKEEKQSDDLRRKAQRLQSGRRIYETDSVDGELKPAAETNANRLDPQKGTESSYQRVYSDWKPTIDKTDVVGVMEAIDDVQEQSQVKDKSPWRKSNLNVSNDNEDVDDFRKLRRTRSRGDGSSPLESIKEEDKRKGLIEKLSKNANDEDSLVVYFRRPLEQQQESTTDKYTKVRNSPLPNRKNPPSDTVTDLSSKKEEMLPPFAPRRSSKKFNNDESNDKRIDKEIDADNLETPPVCRRFLSSNNNNHHHHQSDIKSNNNNNKTNDGDKKSSAANAKSSSDKKKSSSAVVGEDEEILGDGQFERFSSARRTRRYRKLTEDDHQSSRSKVAAGGNSTIEDNNNNNKPIKRPTMLNVATTSCMAVVDKDEGGSGGKENKMDDNKNEAEKANSSVGGNNEDNKSKDELTTNKKKSMIAVATPKTNRIPVFKHHNFTRGGRLYSTLPYSFKNKTDPAPAIAAGGTTTTRIPSTSCAIPRNNHDYNNTDDKSIEGNPAVVINPSLAAVNIGSTDKLQSSLSSSNNKGRSDHDLNDEGFEETQSLISDSPSLTTSSGNYDIDIPDVAAVIDHAAAQHRHSIEEETICANIDHQQVHSKIAKRIPKRYPSLIRFTNYTNNTGNDNQNNNNNNNNNNNQNNNKIASTERKSINKHCENSSSSTKTQTNNNNALSKIPNHLKRTDSNSSQKKQNSTKPDQQQPTKSSSSSSSVAVVIPPEQKSLIYKKHVSSASSKKANTAAANSSQSTTSSIVIPKKITTGIGQLERSSSKSSLRSSKSSLNSFTSISTVIKDNTNNNNNNNNNRNNNITDSKLLLFNNKKIDEDDFKVNTTIASNLSKNNNLKRPLTPIQLKSRNSTATNNNISTTPSSGLRKPKAAIPLILTNSFKENSEDFEDLLLDGMAIATTPRTDDTIDQKSSPTASFMRPTASSSAKDMTDGGNKSRLKKPKLYLSEEKQYV